MSEIDNLCMACMGDKGDNLICPHCGYGGNDEQMDGALPLKHELQNRYIVGKAMDCNGEGIGYIGYDKVDKAPVYVREYMPLNLCFRGEDKANVIVAKGSEISFREGESSFLNYNRRLASLRNLKAIIPIYDIFSQNGTQYVIAEWVENITLKEFVERSGGRIDWNTARPLFMPIISSLDDLNRAGIHHLGISPENLIILRTGKMKLKGFSIPDVRKKDTDLKPELFNGCAAIEQYTSDSILNECSDVYALVACLFFALTGEIPPSATKRKSDGRLLIPTDILKELPPHVVTAIANGLQVDKSRRTKTLERLRDELSAAPTVTVAVEDITYKEEPSHQISIKKSKKKLSNLQWGFIIGAVVIVIIGVFYFVLFANSSSNKSSNNTSSASTSSQASSSSSVNSGEISVPNLVGLDYDKAQQVASQQGNYQILVSSEEFSDTVEQGAIISQTPSFSATNKMSKGTVIAVVVSKGSSTRPLPDVAGMTLSEASSTLTAQGFIPQKGTEKYSSSYDEGVVIDYDDFNVGDYVKYGSTVRLMVSDGKNPNSTTSSANQ